MKKILTVVGARPQFIKAAAISRAISQRHANRFVEVLVHTGQHYDANMSQVFFDELQIPAPKYNMEISGGGHGAMTGRMMEGVEKIIQEERPDWLLIYGDTNSTLAGALTQPPSCTFPSRTWRPGSGLSTCECLRKSTASSRTGFPACFSVLLKQQWRI